MAALSRKDLVVLATFAIVVVIIAVIWAAFEGFSLGKTAALRDNARDQAQRAQQS